MKRQPFGSLAKYRRLGDVRFWEEYARKKNEWEAKNPGADEKAYDKAIDRIATEMGV